MRLDPTLLEILGTKAAAAAEEMSYTLQRTGRTLYVKETADFATGLVRGDGLFFAYPRSVGVAFFVALDCGATIRAVPDLEPGDVIITNDPYRSQGLATHLPDLHLIRPYFHDGKIVCYGWCFIHSTDVGGRVPSSISPANQEIFQEGLMIPPMKIVKRGEFNPDFVTLFTANCRTPEDNLGDIKAMLASLHTGQQRVTDIIEQHGLETFMACQTDLIEYTEAKARDALRRIPDGTYEFWDYLDDDFVSNVPVRVRLAMTVKDGAVTLDFTGSDPQVAAAYNMPTGGRTHVWLIVQMISFICTYDKTVPMNGGLLKPISVVAPAGSVVHAEFPAPVGIRTAPGKRIMDITCGAIHKAAPGLVAAARSGASAPLTLAEYDPETARRNVLVVQHMVGSTGARKGHDGIDARDTSLANLANNPLEILESDAGIIVREYAIRPDSGGPGQWRGGVSQQITFEVLRDAGTVLARGMERVRFRPWGMAGGKPGASQRAVLNRGRQDERELGKLDALPVGAGDTLTVLMPGGGGYGDPFLRDTAAVLNDVRCGYVSAEGARRDYGVAIVDGAIDEAATAKLRAAPRPEPGERDFDFGAEREIWESVFDDATMSEMNQRLFGLAKPLRTAKRRWVFDQAVPNLPRAGDASLSTVMADAAGAKRRLRRALDTLPDPKPAKSAAE